MNKLVILVFLFLISFVGFISLYVIILNTQHTIPFAYAQGQKFPIIMTNSSQFAIDLVNKGIKGANMAFLGPNDILVLDTKAGKVNRIINGQMIEEPLIDLNSFHQDGLIGIATTRNETGQPYVFLYLNEAPPKYGRDVSSKQEAETLTRVLGYNQEGDRLYRYKLVDNKLVEPKLLLEIRAPQPSNNLGVMHHGGEVIIGPDGGVYVSTGDLEGYRHGFNTTAQNYINGTQPDGRAGILTLTQEGQVVGKGILGTSYPLNLYYAYGIRNSFGMDFDPVTGNLWATENGPEHGDEINLVEPGFNSGSDIVWGIPTESDKLHNLVDFGGKGKYSDPEFSWNTPVAPTAITFLDSDKFGKEYKNDMFVADFNNGTIYRFDLNENRTALVLPGPLKDKIADVPSELHDAIFAKNFEHITDMSVGPDGYLYVLGEGNLFKIRPVVDHG